MSWSREVLRDAAVSLGRISNYGLCYYIRYQPFNVYFPMHVLYSTTLEITLHLPRLARGI